MVVLKIVFFAFFVSYCQAREIEEYHVFTALLEPFITKATAPDSRWGYEGILVDMWDYFRARDKNSGKFNVTFTEMDEYGEKLSNGSWTGMIGKISNTDKIEESFGVADITVTSKRLDAIKFTLPYLTTGLTAVGKIDFPVNQENLPKLLKMAQDGKVTVGCQKDISTEVFFKNTDIDIYKKLYEQMKKTKDNFVNSNEEGLDKVRKSSKNKPYVFFAEKAYLDYLLGKAPCDLKIPACDTLNTIHYAFVINKKRSDDNNKYINQLITDYLASGKMEESKQKWYKNECHDKTVSKP